MAIRTRAPLRLDLAGGWTDVPPFSAEKGGVVVNGAITLSAQAEVRGHGEGMTFQSHDLGASLEVRDPLELRNGGPLDLLTAAWRTLPVGPPVEVETRSDAPPGSGLGSSGALGVALTLALSLMRDEHRDSHDLAHMAWQAEVVEAKMPGGKQDQFAAAHGGFNLFEFDDPAVRRTALVLDPEFAEVLARQLVLCYTGRSRVSGATIGRVMDAYRRRESRVINALHELKDLGSSMADALRSADLAGVGALLNQNWACQCALDREMQTDSMRKLERAARDAGAIGGKAAGAGAGGCMFFLTSGDPEGIRDAARQLGMPVIDFDWSTEGARAHG